MPFCPNCGAEHAGAKFCPECGTPQPSAGQQAPAQPDPERATPPAAPPDEVLEETLLEGESKDFKSRATGGRVVPARYRVTTRHVYWQEGVVSTKSEQVPLWAVRDIDVRQSFMQKRKGLGDVWVRVEHSDYTGRPGVLLKWIDDPFGVRDLINRGPIASGWPTTSGSARASTVRRRRSPPRSPTHDHASPNTAATSRSSPSIISPAENLTNVSG
jgi:Bacterial PH domain